MTEKLPTLTRKDGTVLTVRKKMWRPHFEMLSDIEAKDVKFLWRPYIPAGTLTLLFGYGGLGKSWITCAIAADLSSGRGLPGQAAIPPQKVLMISAEDDPAHIIKPRMEALNANMANIAVSDESFTLDEEHINGLKDVMREYAATVVFLDPIVSYLGGEMDMNKSNETRSMMGPLNEAAKETGTAVVVVAHSKKEKKGRSANRVMGSADFINSVRSALMVDETRSGATVMSHVKHNWSSKGDPLYYSVVNDRFQWEGVADVDPAMVEPPAQVEKGRQWIFDHLKDGPRPSLDLFKEAAKEGLSRRTLERSKKGLAHATKTPQGWVWDLLTRDALASEPVVISTTRRSQP